MRMHYVVLGPTWGAKARADIVLLHGLAANVAFWFWKVAPALARSDRVLLVDLRGHGLSSTPPSGYTAQAMAEDLRAQLDLLEMPSIHLLGHSFGGRVAVHFASTYPERVRSLMLADVLLKPLQDWPIAAAPAMWSTYRALLAREGIRIDGWTEEPSLALLEGLARLRLKLDGRPAGPPRMPGPFFGQAGRRSALKWLQLLERTTARQDIPRHDGVTPRRLAALNSPAMLVYGERSPAMATALALRDLWPQAALDVVPGAGHFFPLARPERLIAAVQPFLDGHTHG
jgi:pimeloyl-ACP methyl ester carboxylesterase